MKLKHPLADMIQNCATLCEPECCGVDAYDFSPFHIASFLIRYTGQIDRRTLQQIKSQLAALNAEYGENGSLGKGLALHEMNQVFSGEEITKLVSELNVALRRARELIAQEGL